MTDDTHPRTAAGSPVECPVGRLGSERLKLTPAQLAMLRNERYGRPLCAGLVGRSAHGGATWTVQSLLKRGLLKRSGGLTPAGAEALAQADSKTPNANLTGRQRVRPWSSDDCTD